MKFFIVIVIQIVLSIQFISAQENTLAKKDQYDFFMKKRNTYNTLGWVSLGAGITMIAIGGLEGLGDAFGTSSRYRNDNKIHGTGLAVAGEIVALGSIPFFIIAHKNKKKAALAIKNENVYINDRLLYDSYVALSFKVRL